MRLLEGMGQPDVRAGREPRTERAVPERGHLLGLDRSQHGRHGGGVRGGGRCRHASNSTWPASQALMVASNTAPAPVRAAAAEAAAVTAACSAATIAAMVGAAAGRRRARRGADRGRRSRRRAPGGRPPPRRARLGSGRLAAPRSQPASSARSRASAVASSAGGALVRRARAGRRSIGQRGGARR